MDIASDHCFYAKEYQDIYSTYTFIETVIVTLFSLFLFIVLKKVLQAMRQRWCRATMVIIGAGPIGLLSALIGINNDNISKIIMFEKEKRNKLLHKPHQIGLNTQNVIFLKQIGVDFDNIEGCWQHGCFFTRISVFVEYLLSFIQYLDSDKIRIKFNTEFTRTHLSEVDSLTGRVITIVCDGIHGKSASIFGLSDEFSENSCHAYGALATIERPDSCAVPAPELCVHNLTFNLSAYTYDNGNNCLDCSTTHKPSVFHLKIFGSLQQRCMALAIPHSESKMVKMLKVVLDRSVMRNIFQMCFNTYKSEEDKHMSDSIALRYMQFSPRLFDITLSTRAENVVYFKDSDMFVLAEGDAARYLNFHTGMDINISIEGLQSLKEFVQKAVVANTETSIKEAITFKHKHSVKIAQTYIENGIRDCIFNSVE